MMFDDIFVTILFSIAMYWAINRLAGTWMPSAPQGGSSSFSVPSSPPEAEPVGHSHRRDRATIHLFDALRGVDTTGWTPQEVQDYAFEFTSDMFNQEDFDRLLPYLRRGDLLEEVNTAGYRSSGVFMFDGVRVREIDNRVDEYGSPGPQYIVYREFNPFYWEYSD